MSRHIFIAAFFILLMGCASKPLTQEKIKDIREVHVASLLGDEVPLRFIGTTVYNNQDIYAQVGNWTVNQFIVSEMSKNLASKKIKVKLFAFDKQKAREVHSQANSGVGSLFVPENDDKTRDFLVQEAARKNVKFLITITRMSSDNFALYPSGFGLFCRAPFGLKGEAQAYGMYGLQLWDVSTKERLFYTYFTPESSAVKTGKSCEDLAKKKPEAIATDSKKYLEESFSRTVRVALEESGLLEKKHKN